MTCEAQALGKDHSLAPDDVIDAVARALRRSVGQTDLDAVRATLPPGAAEFWQVADPRPGELGPRIVRAATAARAVYSATASLATITWLPSRSPFSSGLLS